MFYDEPSNVVDGKNFGEFVDIAVVEDGIPFTIKVVST